MFKDVLFIKNSDDVEFPRLVTKEIPSKYDREMEIYFL